MSEHIDSTLSQCAQSLHALRVLRSNGLNIDSLHVVFNAVIMAKLFYAAPAWWGFAITADEIRIDAFLRRCKKYGYYRPDSSCSSKDIVCTAEKMLFRRVVANAHHVLYPLLPAEKAHNYDLRKRTHNFSLPVKSSALNDRNFFSRLLYEDCY